MRYKKMGCTRYGELAEHHVWGQEMVCRRCWRGCRMPWRRLGCRGCGHEVLEMLWSSICETTVQGAGGAGKAMEQHSRSHRTGCRIWGTHCPVGVLRG